MQEYYEINDDSEGDWNLKKQNKNSAFTSPFL